jgi:hypothetical protein
MSGAETREARVAAAARPASPAAAAVGNIPPLSVPRPPHTSSSSSSRTRTSPSARLGRGRLYVVVSTVFSLAAAATALAAAHTTWARTLTTSTAVVPGQGSTSTTDVVQYGLYAVTRDVCSIAALTPKKRSCAHYEETYAADLFVSIPGLSFLLSTLHGAVVLFGAAFFLGIALARRLRLAMKRAEEEEEDGGEGAAGSLRFPVTPCSPSSPALHALVWTGFVLTFVALIGGVFTIAATPSTAQPASLQTLWLPFMYYPSRSIDDGGKLSSASAVAALGAGLAAAAADAVLEGVQGVGRRGRGECCGLCRVVK